MAEELKRQTELFNRWHEDKYQWLDHRAKECADRFESWLASYRAQLPSQGGEAVAWARQCDLDESDPAIFVAREEVQESGYDVPLYTRPADPGAVAVAVRRELMERLAHADQKLRYRTVEEARYWLDQYRQIARALLADSEGVK